VPETQDVTPGVFLPAIGWDAARREQFIPWAAEGCTPGRVARVDRTNLLVLGAAGSLRAEPSTSLRREAEAFRDASALPAAGDWVALRPRPQSEVWEVEAVLPRTSAFVRRAPDAHGDGQRGPARGGEAQVLAANVDVAFLVAAATDARAGRLERAAALAWESGATPVIVLTKADLSLDSARAIGTAEEAVPGVPVHLVDALHGDGTEVLGAYVEGRRTVALLGASGVGKSTLANALLGGEVLATGAIREADGRGRHTTVARHLVPLPGGGAIIDTPGLRSIALWGADEGIAQVFSDIEALAGECRFSDCAHDREPGCAVRQAIQAGGLDAKRLERYRRLERERAHLERRADPLAQAERRKHWAQISKSLRQRPDKKHRA
jgi:ribosome biogenesis GTPase / thiamine phosphate phosphatase